MKYVFFLFILFSWTKNQEVVVTDPCFELTLEAENVLRPSQALALKLKLKNICEQTLTIYLRRNPAYDFVLSDLEGIEQGRWSQGKAIAMSLMILPLEPGQEHTLEESWNLVSKHGDPIPAGHYSLQGFLKGEWPNIYQTNVMQLEILP